MLCLCMLYLCVFFFHFCIKVLKIARRWSFLFNTLYHYIFVSVLIYVLCRWHLYFFFTVSGSNQIYALAKTFFQLIIKLLRIMTPLNLVMLLLPLAKLMAFAVQLHVHKLL
jgi:hypothetical protein